MIPRIIHKRAVRTTATLHPENDQPHGAPASFAPPSPRHRRLLLWFIDDGRASAVGLFVASTGRPADASSSHQRRVSRQSASSHASHVDRRQPQKPRQCIDACGTVSHPQTKHPISAQHRCPRGPGRRAGVGERMSPFLEPPTRRKKAKHDGRPRILSAQPNAVAGGGPCDWRALRPQRAVDEGSTDVRTSQAMRARRAGRRAGRGTGNRTADLQRLR
jgi:hypothetical protein